MPSKNPVIAVRLDPAMHRQVVALAAAQHRSVSNFVEHALRRLIGPDNEAVLKEIERTDPANRGGRQVDIAEAIAAAVKRGPTKASKHK